MEILEALHWRYATKTFDANQKVADADLTTILESGNLAATSYGLQPFRFVVVSDQDTQDRLVPHSYRQPQVSQASHVIIIAARTDIDADYIREYAAMVEKARDLPVGQLDGYAKQMIGSLVTMSDDQRMDWAKNQAYIALGNLMVACAALKIDSCPMEGFIASEYDTLLDLSSQNLTSTVVLPIGYRAADDATADYVKVRRPIEEMVIHISRPN